MKWPRVVLFVPLVGMALAGCSGSSPVAQPSPVPVSSPSSSGSPRAGRTAPAPPPAPTPSQSSGFGEAYAVNCNGRPGLDRVLAVLRAKGLVSGSAKVTAQAGPLCAGTWQYTVLDVVGQGPLQVVTQGPPASLRLVTAGTDVCSTELRTQAPLGILTAAQCSG
jgi:hypothetical protein